MASTRAQQGALLSSSLFLQQVAGSLLNYANGVLTEDPMTANHPSRLQLARAIFTASGTLAGVFAPVYLTNANVSAAAGTPSSIADSDVDTVTSAQYDNFSKFYSGQAPTGAVLLLGS